MYRKAGLTYQEIANEMNCSPQVAHKLVSQELCQIRETNADAADELRALELERLDTLYRHAFTAVTYGDVPAIDRCIRVMERRARLTGIDAATRTEISGALLTSPEWLELKTLLVHTLGQYPEAQRAVLAAIAPKEVNT